MTLIKAEDLPNEYGIYANLVRLGFELVGELRVCPGCHYYYSFDAPFECENQDCKRYGKDGVPGIAIVAKKLIESKEVNL